MPYTVAQLSSVAASSTQMPILFSNDESAGRNDTSGRRISTWPSTCDFIASTLSEVSSDVILEVNGTRYLLHKFPLLSKCLRLQSMFPESSYHQLIQLRDFPGGTDAFELCAKFCYGVTITVSAYNILSARCAAEYLMMTEDVEKGNLLIKLEVFFNSCILTGWKDSILALNTTKSFPSWSQERDIADKCIETIACKVHSQSSEQKKRQGWWIQDIAELEVDLYWRTMIVIKSGGKIPSQFIGDALMFYTSKNLKMEQENSMPGMLLESIVSLLPIEKDSVSCRFLCKLFKAANILKASVSSKTELARRIGIQLDEATVSDLLIPSCANDMIYDVDTVIIIVEQFVTSNPQISPPRTKKDYERRRSRSAENFLGFEESHSKRFSSASHTMKSKIARLIDCYLQKISLDENLPVRKFVLLAEAVPSSWRIKHDDLYRAIDIYLKLHPNLEKYERKAVCGIMDCKKLSMQASLHAASNERLPLRVVVQVLFFEQSRAVTGGGYVNDLANKIEPVIADRGSMQSKSLKSNLSTLRMKLAEDEDEFDDDDDDYYNKGIENSSGVKSFCLIPTLPKRIFRKLWSIKGSRV